jgi:glyoxylase-like metal-dependent hydrolase (beta-lactamase superfamily II)
MEQWFEGVYLLGQFNRLRAGCWLLRHGDEAAILEMPPHDRNEPSPEAKAAAAVIALKVSVKYLICTHAHMDHYCDATLAAFRRLWPGAAVHLQRGFEPNVAEPEGIHWFDRLMKLNLGGEPLFLIHAPKHSTTDTMVIFRGAICTGDWELRTIQSVHDGRSGITTAEKLESIQRLIGFVSAHNYHIHQVFSVHANDRRTGVNFVDLMEDTRVNRTLWQ